MCHNPNIDPGNASLSISWEKATKEMMSRGYGNTARKTIQSFRENMASLYLDSKLTVPGHKIAAFMKKEEWMGVDGLNGCRQVGEGKILTARLAAITGTAIEFKLLVGLKLRVLALDMVKKTYNWFIVLYRHLDTELLHLSQMHLDTKALLVLLSKEVIILFTIIHNICKKGLEFSTSCDPLEYMVKCIWLTIEIHGAMEIR